MRDLFEAGVALAVDALPNPLHFKYIGDDDLLSITRQTSKILRNYAAQVELNIKYTKRLVSFLETQESPDADLKEVAEYMLETSEFGHQIEDAHLTMLNQLLAELAARGINYTEEG